MIVCPNCKHENPEGATNCEACYTALPATKACPSCGASIQIDATFCGQCGHNLKSTESKSPILLPPPATLVTESVPVTPPVSLPPTVLTNSVDESLVPASNAADLSAPTTPPTADPESLADPIASEVQIEPPPSFSAIEPEPVAVVSEPEIEILTPPATIQMSASAHQLLHLQTNTLLEIPPHLTVVHLGKPNDQTAPDIDVSGFPCAEVVSRIHANIRIEEENYYIEDVGSANGTYINHNVLAKGNRHLLRTGDRIGLGKGDLVTFIFQSSV
jgi:pSer/pThr/pTyr-binding forkhead associated (FHA) protein/ribosomal protein L40E